MEFVALTYPKQKVKPMKTNTLPQNRQELFSQSQEHSPAHKTSEPTESFNDDYNYFPDFGI